MSASTPGHDFPLGKPVVKTLLLTDFVNSTQFVSEVGDVAAARILAQVDRIARDLMKKNRGQEIDKTDGFLLIFDRPIDAVHFALEFHTALDELDLDGAKPLTARAGLHLGEVILHANPPDDVARGAKPIELEGLAKPTVARISSLATSRQTLVTHSVFDLGRRASVGDKQLPDDTQWLEHGQFLLDGIEDPISVYEVGISGFAPLSPPANSEKVRRVAWDEGSAPRGRNTNNRLAWIAAAVVVLTALAGFWLWSMSSTSPPAEEKADSGSQDPPQPTKAALALEVAQNETVPAGEPPQPELLPKTVALQVISEPPGATLWQGAASMGKTPVVIHFPGQAGSHVLEARLDGYETRTVSCALTSDDIARGSCACAFIMQGVKSAAIDPPASDESVDPKKKPRVTSAEKTPPASSTQKVKKPSETTKTRPPIKIEPIPEKTKPKIHMIKD